MRAKDLQGFGPVGTNGPTDTPAEVAVNHADAHDLAFYTQANSNLARCYLDLERQLAEASAVTDMLMLCGEREVRDVEGYPDKLRALIDGLIDQRRRADALQSQLAAQRERDGRDAAIGAALQRAAAELPEGWQVHVTVERGAGWATFSDPDCNDHDADWCDGDLAGSINNAIDAALKDRP